MKLSPKVKEIVLTKSYGYWTTADIDAFALEVQKAAVGECVELAHHAWATTAERKIREHFGIEEQL